MTTGGIVVAGACGGAGGAGCGGAGCGDGAVTGAGVVCGATVVSTGSVVDVDGAVVVDGSVLVVGRVGLVGLGGVVGGTDDVVVVVGKPDRVGESPIGDTVVAVAIAADSPSAWRPVPPTTTASVVSATATPRQPARQILMAKGYEFGESLSLDFQPPIAVPNLTRCLFAAHGATVALLGLLIAATR